MTDHPTIKGESLAAPHTELVKVYNYFGQLPVAVAVFKGPAQVIDYVNGAYCQLIGKTAPEIIGQPLFTIFPELKNSSIEEIHQRVMTTGVAEQIDENPVTYLVNGMPYSGYFNTRFQPLKDEAGSIVGLMVSGYDVTETVAEKKRNEQREERLQKAKEQMELGINTGKVGLWYWDAATDTLTWSQEQLQLFGLTDHSAINRVADFHRFVFPEDLHRMYENRESTPGASGAPADYAYKFRIRRTDGAVRWLQARSRTFFDASGQLVYITGVNIDITEQEEIRQQLEASERRLRSLAENSPDVITRHGRDFKYLYISPRIESYTGLKPEHFIGRSYQEAGFPDNLCRFFDEALSYVFSTGQPHQVYYSMPGDSRHIFSRLIPELNEKGEIESVLIISTDITEQKLVEEQLKANEGRFRTLGNSIAQLAWMADETGFIYWYNDRWYAYTGTRLEDMQGWGWQAVHHPDHQDRVVRFVQEAWTKDEPWELTFPLRRHDGVYRWFLTRVYPIKNQAGRVVQWIGTNTDIHEQLETQQALRQSEAELRVLADFQPQIVWTANKAGLLDYVNKRWEEYTGSPAGEAHGGGWYNWIHTEDQEASLASWNLSVATGQYYEVESRIRRHDGVYRWYLSRGQALRDASGQIIKWFGTSTDIHDRKTMAVQLEALVQERTRALQRSNEDLQQFAHVASHDLKEPVRKMKTFTSLLEMELGEGLSAKARICLEKMNSATDRMFSMINGVLSYSTFNAMEEVFQPVDLNQVLEQISADLELPIQEKGALLQVSGLPTVPGVPLLLYQLFYNLINNSLKFTRSGIGPHIIIEAAPTSLNGAPAVAITLTDNGIGFKQEYAGQIFNTFTRLHSKDEYEGNGLGLALCKKIAERHGGLISAGGAENQGAVFTIVLPV